MKVKLNFKQIVDIVNLDITSTGVTYEDARERYPNECIVDVDPICIFSNEVLSETANLNSRGGSNEKI